ncbi:NAD(P)-dependent oxidoreductase [Persicitalea jodogahamensis]|uniref:NADH-flavin reductase n=1 Tax=Persicitalea jodogahamensis TaxID=402147 RepID=A0A8J3D8C6_9BACT|nr:NAD(P)H-binding protein [Persicitalea jodogahamensis]GHB68083.1 NADH-flavin reductase [Persicitalea jodogahamensis]
MKQKPKVAVIGGTGKAGKYLVKELLRQNFPFKLLLRNPDNFSIETTLAELVAGDARNYEAVRTLLEDCQAVISTLGQPAGQPAIFSQATENVLRAMEGTITTRFIVITGAPVDAPGDRKGEWAQTATDWMKANYPETTNDKQVEYQKLTESQVAWTLVRLPWIELTEVEQDVKVSLEDCPGETVSASALARFLVAQLTDDTYVRQAPFVAT